MSTGASNSSRDYYEAEAAAGTRRELRGVRLSIRRRFVQLLVAEGRPTVGDFGAGPGLDTLGFAAEGIGAVGIDLAHTNCVRGAAHGAAMVQASVDAVPLRTGVLAAAWSMSTLMHLDDASARAAVGEIARTVQPGGPLQIGVWGLPQAQLLVFSDPSGNTRPFHLRSLHQNSSLFGASADIAASDVVHHDDNGWEYQVFLLRCR
ncbi:MAG: class I SAM-dependent methyltransferase [Acidimicrobiales bacterium]